MGTHGPGKKRILRSFTLTKLALVDDPAQEGADIVLRKRNLEKAKFAVMTSSDEGHSHLVEEWSDAGPYAGTTSSATMTDAAGSYHSHPWQILDDGTIEVGESAGHTHTVDATKMLAAMKSWALRTSAEQARYAAERAAYAHKRNQGNPAADEARDDDAAREGGGQTETKMTKQVEKTADDKAAPDATAVAKIELLEKRLVRQEAVAKLNDAGKEHLAKLADDPARDRFLAMPEADQAAELRKAAVAALEADPIEYVAKSNGRTYRRSAGADVIDIAKQLDTERAARLLTDTALRKSTLLKRAEAELSNLPGTVEERAELLAAVESHAGGNDELRKKMLAALTAGNAAVKKAFVKADGTTEGATAGTGAAAAKLDTLAKARQKEKGLDYFAAYGQVADENKDLAEAALASEEAEGEL